MSFDCYYCNGESERDHMSTDELGATQRRCQQLSRQFKTATGTYRIDCWIWTTDILFSHCHLLYDVVLLLLFRRCVVPCGICTLFFFLCMFHWYCFIRLNYTEYLFSFVLYLCSLHVWSGNVLVSLHGHHDMMVDCLPVVLWRLYFLWLLSVKLWSYSCN